VKNCPVFYKKATRKSLRDFGEIDAPVTASRCFSQGSQLKGMHVKGRFLHLEASKFDHDLLKGNRKSLKQHI